MMVVQICYIISYGVFMNLPHDESKKRFQMLFNESIFMTLLIHMMGMSEFVVDPMTQYKVGKSFLVVITVCVVVNLYMSFSRSVYLLILKIY